MVCHCLFAYVCGGSSEEKGGGGVGMPSQSKKHCRPHIDVKLNAESETVFENDKIRIS